MESLEADRDKLSMHSSRGASTSGCSSWHSSSDCRGRGRGRDRDRGCDKEALSPARSSPPSPLPLPLPLLLLRAEGAISSSKEESASRLRAERVILVVAASAAAAAAGAGGANGVIWKVSKPTLEDSSLDGLLLLFDMFGLLLLFYSNSEHFLRWMSSVGTAAWCRKARDGVPTRRPLGPRERRRGEM